MGRIPSGPLPQMHLAPGDQPVNGHLRAGRGLGVRHRQPLRPGRDRRPLIGTFGTPAEPGLHSSPASVPGVDRHSSPEQFEDFSDLVVRDRGQRPSLAELFGGLAHPDPVVADRVRIAERVKEHVRRRRPDGQRLPGRQLHDGGHGFPLVADRAAPRGGYGTSPQVTDQVTADVGVLSVGRLRTGPAADTPAAAHQGRRGLSARSDMDVPHPPNRRPPPPTPPACPTHRAVNRAGCHAPYGRSVWQPTAAPLYASGDCSRMFAARRWEP